MFVQVRHGLPAPCHSWCKRPYLVSGTRLGHGSLGERRPQQHAKRATHCYPRSKKPLAFWRLAVHGRHPLRHGWEGFNALWKEFQRSAIPFKFVVERVSFAETRFLNLFIGKEGSSIQSGQVSYEAVRKDTAIGQPLAPSSGHPIMVHIRWPLSLERTRRLRSTRKKAEDQVRTLRETWRRKVTRCAAASLSKPHSATASTPMLPLVVHYSYYSSGSSLRRWLKGANNILAALPGFVHLGLAWRLDDTRLSQLTSA